MNKKGFTLIELLGTLIILGIIIGITIVSISSVMDSAKKKSEEAFIDTLEDAIRVYLDSDGRSAKYGSDSVCTINKSHAKEVKIYKAIYNKKGENITFNTIIDSSYRPIEENALINPANKEYGSCVKNLNYSDAAISLYKDDDGVYYYKFNTSNWECLKSDDAKKIVTDLPCICLSDSEKSLVYGDRCKQ